MLMIMINNMTTPLPPSSALICLLDPAPARGTGGGGVNRILDNLLLVVAGEKSRRGAPRPAAQGAGVGGPKSGGVDHPPLRSPGVYPQTTSIRVVIITTP